jgi:hypothetical protein
VFVFLQELLVDPLNRALVVGYTADPNVVTTPGTFSTSPLGGEDIILSRINAAGTAVQAGTYFGGSGDDFANGIALGSALDVYLTGSSASTSDYPITIGGPPSGGGVATKLDSALSTVSFSRTVSGTGLDIAVDRLGRSSVFGGDNFEAVFTHLSASGFLEHETFWGGGLFDTANAVALDSLGHAYVTGETRSSGFPGDTVLNPSPFQGSISGNKDAWVLKLLRDDPVPPLPSVPGLHTGVGMLIVALGVLGVRALRTHSRRARPATESAASPD